MRLLNAPLLQTRRNLKLLHFTCFILPDAASAVRKERRKSLGNNSLNGDRSAQARVNTRNTMTRCSTAKLVHHRAEEQSASAWTAEIIANALALRAFCRLWHAISPCISTERRCSRRVHKTSAVRKHVISLLADESTPWRQHLASCTHVRDTRERCAEAARQVNRVTILRSTSSRRTGWDALVRTNSAEQTLSSRIVSSRRTALSAHIEAR